MGPQGVVLGWLGAAEEIFGYSRTEALGSEFTVEIPAAAPRAS